MFLRLSLAIGLVAAATLGASAQSATESWRLGGLKMPESVIFDTANNRLIVTNMVTFGPDGGADGYLSLVSPDGKLVTEQWTTGLTDPKGMAIVGDSLFVADSNGLVEIKLSDGSIVTTHALEGAMFPNDVTSDGTDIYVSDLMGSAIYKLAGGTVEKWLADEQLATPNGLFIDGKTLIVGSMGTGMKPDFTFDSKGGLQAVDLATKAITPLTGAMEIALTDGVARLGDSLVFDDNPAGTILSYADDKVTTLTTLAPGAADLWVEGKVVYVPLTQTGELVALTVE
ncbi:hypothetical protein ASC89_11895 [Devosia sp. Root413D1]|uniref:PQQ-binding-like beta-propeller repeat protein n=1 Tax=Devosia sp. Root413D1 TaxID=1736531 RepID=UPI0007018815|nr:PQQ-binding-like beta-propeller repeat protein [Devosia sp. Root413D1]KQW79003.1 hypothetical protein ASC89_11895 [Devosia sp. Root413D1]